MNNKPIIYSSPLPYPEIKVLGSNKNYAEILMDAYAGSASELTAINQYLYHSFDLDSDNNNRELKQLYRNIAIVEMKHLSMLANVIKLLGVDPIFRGSVSTRNNYWNASFVYYGTDICERLKTDINAEKIAIRYYNESISLIKDPHIQAILKRIILDEEVHIELFKSAIEKYKC